MSQCPKCGAPVDHDFGVTSCAKCAAVLFVDFDGQIQMADPAGGEVSAVSTLAPTDSSQLEEIQALSEVQDSDLQVSQSESLAVWENSPIEEDAPVLVDDVIDADVPSELPTEFSGAFGDEMESNSPPISEPVASPSNLDFSDVLEFANRAELDNTPLLYTLWIEGIDHRDIRRKVEAVLSEPRLNFHLKELLPSIRGGILELRDLNPAKTNFIANRLRGEAVRFRWRQSVFGSESESEPGAADLGLPETGTES